MIRSEIWLLMEMLRKNFLSPFFSLWIVILNQYFFQTEKRGYIKLKHDALHNGPSAGNWPQIRGVY